MTDSKRVETVALPDGKLMQIEISGGTGYQEVGATDGFNFEDVTRVLESLGASLDASLARMKPTKASIEFGMGVALESGKLTTLICQGKTNANFTVRLEWGK